MSLQQRKKNDLLPLWEALCNECAFSEAAAKEVKEALSLAWERAYNSTLSEVSVKIQELQIIRSAEALRDGISGNLFKQDCP